MIEPTEMFPPQAPSVPASTAVSLLDELLNIIVQRVVSQVVEKLDLSKLNAPAIDETALDARIGKHVDDAITYFKDYELAEAVKECCDDSYWFDSFVENAVNDLDLSDKVKEEIQSLEFTVSVR